MTANCEKWIQNPKKIGQIIFAGTLCLLLTACASLNGPDQPYNKTIHWKQREAKLSKIKQWIANGDIAIETPHQAESANVDWQQGKKEYNIELFGPLGIGGATINGKPGKVTLIQDSGKVLTADNPEDLIEKAMGWNLPISDLYFWIRGIPAPSHYQKAEFDQYNHLRILLQKGWLIHYIRYAGWKNQDLPYQMTLERPKLMIKITVNRWVF